MTRRLHVGVGFGGRPPRRNRFLPKPIDRVRWSAHSDDVAALYDQRRRVRELEEQVAEGSGIPRHCGQSPAMLEVFDFARKVAPPLHHVLLIGATGTGKEWWARAIHQSVR